MNSKRRGGRRRGLALPWIMVGVGAAAMVGTVVWDYFEDPKADPVQRFMNGSRWTKQHRENKERAAAILPRMRRRGPGVRPAPSREETYERMRSRFDQDGDGRILVAEISALRRGVPYVPAPLPGKGPAPLRIIGGTRIDITPLPAPGSPFGQAAGWTPPPPDHPAGPSMGELLQEVRRNHAALVAALEDGDAARAHEARERFKASRRRLKDAKQAYRGA